MSKQKREEEQRVLAQMDEAMKEEKVETSKDGGAAPKKSKPSFNGVQPEQIHCHRCRTLMENGVCPSCGFKTYVPMSEEKRKKIKTITTIIGFVVFIIIFVAIQISKN